MMVKEEELSPDEEVGRLEFQCVILNVQYIN